MKTQIIILINVLLAVVVTSLSGQRQEFDHLHLFYLENSRVTSTGGLSSKQVDLLQFKMEEVKDSPQSKTLLFVSDGLNPILNDVSEGYDNVIAEVYARNMQTPNNLIEERKQLHKVLDSEELDIQEGIHLHIFPTDDMASTLILEWPQLFKYIAGELSFLHNQIPVEVNFYLRETAKFIEQEELISTMRWPSEERSGIINNIKYTLTQL